jgi:hypothetical protein
VARETKAWQLDWGVVAVYSCARSCELNGTSEGGGGGEGPYAEEFVWRQPGHELAPGKTVFSSQQPADDD